MSNLGPTLLGRRDECGALDRLVAQVREGQSQALVLRGEAGVGKSALLDYVVQRAEGCGITRAVGVESEVQLAFAGLHQLCAPFVDRLDRLPAPQRDALGTAFGLRGGPVPDRFVVGLAVLGLLSDVAEARPLICLVDDAQWLDDASAQALAFVARRLGVESVGLVPAVREPSVERHLAGLPELAVVGLGDQDARALLASVVTGPLDARIRDRIVAETRGNPLALLELPRGRTPTELAGGFELDSGPPLAHRIEARFQEQLADLPAGTRLLVLAAAAEPLGDPLLLWRAALALGIDESAAAAAADVGLLELGTQVRFRHPLARSAVYRAAAPEERRRVHAAIAEATDGQTDPDRRAWHRAHATAGLVEAVAAELERSASRARARGGPAAGAAFLERAAELTPDPRLRAQRELAAAEGKHQAGAPDPALRLLTLAQAGPLDELQQARAQLLRAQIVFAATRGRDAPPLLLEAAKRLEPLDAKLARETYLEAFAAALSADRLGAAGDARDVAAAVLAASWPPASRATDLLLDSLALVAAEGYVAAVPSLKRALRAFRAESLPEAEELRWLWLALHIARALGDDVAWDELSARQLELARRAGLLALLPIALDDRAFVELFAGRLAVATALAAEADAVIEATGSHLTMRATIGLATWRGEVDEARVVARREDALRRGEGLWLRSDDWTLAARYSALGRYQEALAAAERAAANPHGLGAAPWELADVIEAAVRSGQPERAAESLEQLAEIAEANGSQFGLALLARSRALLTEGDAAEPLYREALERLAGTRVRLTLARAHLVYGEWLRREKRRVDAREQLRIAHTMLAEMGNAGFAERARHELLATGETVRKRTAETRDDLTPQERQIAELAIEGLSNPEIGARLFVSRRTVEWHLRKVFAKLGISSRRALPSALGDGSTAASVALGSRR